MNSPNLTRSEIRRLSRACRAAGWKLPKVGWIVDVPAAVRPEFRVYPSGNMPSHVAHDAGGYFFTGWSR
jgi:hypothetical protein